MLTRNDEAADSSARFTAFQCLPAGVIGMDLVEQRPAGVQIVGRPFREDLVCDALEAIELGAGVLSHRLW